MGNVRLIAVLFMICLVGCAEKKQATVTPPPAPAPATPPKPAPVAAAPRPIRSEMPTPTAEVILHCVVTKQENANTVSCACTPVTTRIDSKTGHTEIVCKKMKEER
jgi:hypothetical protein